MSNSVELPPRAQCSGGFTIYAAPADSAAQLRASCNRTSARKPLGTIRVTSSENASSATRPARPAKPSAAPEPRVALKPTRTARQPLAEKRITPPTTTTTASDTTAGERKRKRVEVAAAVAKAARSTSGENDENAVAVQAEPPKRAALLRIATSLAPPLRKPAVGQAPPARPRGTALPPEIYLDYSNKENYDPILRRYVASRCAEKTATAATTPVSGRCKGKGNPVRSPSPLLPEWPVTPLADVTEAYTSPEAIRAIREAPPPPPLPRNFYIPPYREEQPLATLVHPHQQQPASHDAEQPASHGTELPLPAPRRSVRIASRQRRGTASETAQPESTRAGGTAADAAEHGTPTGTRRRPHSSRH